MSISKATVAAGGVRRSHPVRNILQRVLGKAAILRERRRRKTRTMQAHRYLHSRGISPPYKLHVGCGPTRFEGWINIDIEARANVDIVWDICQPLPFGDASCALIYHEHVLEHLPVEDGARFLAECHRVLSLGGLMRIAMPSLEVIVDKYRSDEWREQDWLTWPEYQYIRTRAEMLNAALRWWGHQWVYDREELSRRLAAAGFAEIHSVPWGESTCPALRGRETRQDSQLICEAVKTVALTELEQWETVER